MRRFPCWSLLIVAAVFWSCGGPEGPGPGDPVNSGALPPDASTTSSDASLDADASVSPPDASVVFALVVNVLAEISVDEDQPLELAVGTAGAAGPVRLFAEGLPEGAHFDAFAGRLHFTPDFTQGGQRWSVRFTADDGQHRASALSTISVNDTIRPPVPTVARSEPGNGFTRLWVDQRTDTYLDSPSRAGRVLSAVVIVPTAPAPNLPVRVQLHGFGGSPATDGWSGEYRIYPSDPDQTYWWGYQDGAGHVPEYTARRVLHLLAWLLQNNPSASRERVYLDGISMGGAGAMTIGLLWARHFCHVRASFGQAIPRNHRPSRQAQLSSLWGNQASNLDGIWDRMDLTRVLRDVPEAKAQFLTLKHSKDDSTIHFGAVVHPSPLTSMSLYRALQSQRIGHHAIWDEGGHDIVDPVLHGGWWTQGWDPVFDTTALLVLHRAFPAFSKASVDRNPGDGHGNGKRPWNDESGYAANVSVAEDTGWNGDIAGGLNRFLRWDGTRIVDTLDRFEIPLAVLDGMGAPAPRAGYPTTGDKLDASGTVLVDVTPRRVQAFALSAFERVDWQFGAQQGQATADAAGQITIERLQLSTNFTVLRLLRAP